MPETPGPRRFVALALPEELRVDLAAATAHLRPTAAAGLRPASAAGLRPALPAGWHVTLAFLGHLDADLAAVAVEVVAACLRRTAPRPAPRLTLRRAGRFGDRVLVVHITDDPEGSLSAFVTELHTELRSAGFDLPDRSYRPHLTLARARGSRRVTGQDVEALRLPPLRWRPEAVGLWALARDGADHPYDVEVVLPWPEPD